tara:strand:- start:571 stop:861 length:291 start_codon:yes stop_codon:yes gene_type:complete
MARKKGGKSSGFVSQGQRPNVSKWARKAARREYLSNDLAVVLNKQAAYLAGKKVFLTVPNPNKNQTNKPFIRVPASDVWPNPNKRYMMKGTPNAEV